MLLLLLLLLLLLQLLGRVRVTKEVEHLGGGAQVVSMSDTIDRTLLGNAVMT